jgi:hypothetical protein
MTSIRRVGPGSGASRAYSISNNLEVTAPVRQQPMAPVEKVRRGFSDDSDFRADAEGDLEGALLADLDVAGPSGDGDLDAPEPRAELLENDQLRNFAGVSDFQESNAGNIYAKVLGSPQMASSPLLQARFYNQERRAEEAKASDPALDPSDILSPDAAAWELQHLDTLPSSVSSKEAEDLLYLLESGDLSNLSDEELAALSNELGEGDLHEGAPVEDDLVDASDPGTVGAPDAEGDFLATLDDAGEVARVDDAPGTPPADAFLADVDDFTMEAVQAEAAYQAAQAALLKQQAGPGAVEASAPEAIEDVQDADLVEVADARTPPPPPSES